MTQATALSMGSAIGFVLIGIIISLVLPVAIGTLKKAKGLETRQPTWGARLAAALRQYGGNRYVQILGAAAFVAVVLVWMLGLQFSTPRDAVLAGFAWESLVNKLMGGK